MYKEIEKETGVTCYFRVMKYSTWASWVNSEWQSSDDLILIIFKLQETVNMEQH